MSGIEVLQANLGKLNDRDREFAQSLIDQFVSRGLSAKQLPWVQRLVVRATTPATEIGDVAGVLELMSKAGPRGKIVIRASEKLTIRLSVSGEQSRFPGTVAVTSVQQGDGYRNFYGRICKDGTFVPGRDATADNLPSIVAILRRLAADPAGTACEHGKLTGNCCFCSLPLTDGFSVDAGYGPICAKKYSLPWGNRA